MININQDWHSNLLYWIFIIGEPILQFILLIYHKIILVKFYNLMMIKH
jgi:hypothetical protein